MKLLEFRLPIVIATFYGLQIALNYRKAGDYYLLKMGAKTFMLLAVVGFTFQQSIVLQKFTKRILFNISQRNWILKGQRRGWLIVIFKPLVCKGNGKLTSTLSLHVTDFAGNPFLDKHAIFVRLSRGKWSTTCMTRNLVCCAKNRASILSFVCKNENSLKPSNNSIWNAKMW